MLLSWGYGNCEWARRRGHVIVLWAGKLWASQGDRPCYCPGDRKTVSEPGGQAVLFSCRRRNFEQARGRGQSAVLGMHSSYLENGEQRSNAFLSADGPEDLCGRHLQGQHIKALAEVQVAIFVQVPLLGQHPTKQHHQGALFPSWILCTAKLQRLINVLRLHRWEAWLMTHQGRAQCRQLPTHQQGNQHRKTVKSADTIQTTKFAEHLLPVLVRHNQN